METSGCSNRIERDRYSLRFLHVAALLISLGLASVACAPTPTEPDATNPPAVDGTDIELDETATPADDVPVFAEGRVDRREYVEPPIDLSLLPPKGHADPVRVVATIGQVADVVREIAGERATVRQVVPGNDDPHLYVPTPNDVADLAESDIVFYNGLFLEGQMGETFERMASTGVRTVAVTAGMAPDVLLEREYSAGAFVTDPHVWFDPELWGAAAANIAMALSAVDPPNAADYKDGLERYYERLDALSAWGTAVAETIPTEQRVLVTSHDAFGYFGRRFAIEVRGLQGLSTQAEAGSADVDELVRFISQRRVPAVFVEASVNPKALGAVVEAVQAEGGQVRIGGELYSDTPGEEGTAAGTYIGMVLWNLATVATALGGDANIALPPAIAAHPEWDFATLVSAAVAQAAR